MYPRTRTHIEYDILFVSVQLKFVYIFNIISVITYNEIHIVPSTGSHLLLVRQITLAILFLTLIC